jgi:hypothetical protein
MLKMLWRFLGVDSRSRNHRAIGIVYKSQCEYFKNKGEYIDLEVDDAIKFWEFNQIYQQKYGKNKFSFINFADALRSFFENEKPVEEGVYEFTLMDDYKIVYFKPDDIFGIECPNKPKPKSFKNPKNQQTTKLKNKNTSRSPLQKTKQKQQRKQSNNNLYRICAGSIILFVPLFVCFKWFILFRLLFFGFFETNLKLHKDPT